MISPVVYSTGGTFTPQDFANFFQPGGGLVGQAARQAGAQITDTITRIALIAGGIGLVVFAVGLIAKDTAPGLIAETVKGVIEGTGG